MRVHRSVRPSLYPFYSQNCLHILSKVFRSTTKHPTQEVGSIRCGILKNSKELLEHLQSPNFSHITSIKQNRSTEGCSKLKKSVDMTSSGKNGLNIKTNASPKWDRTKCPGGASVLCWLAAPVATPHGNLKNLVIRSKSVIKSSSVIRSQTCVMSDQLMVSLYMVMSQNVM